RAHVLWELLQRGPTTQRVLADAMGVSARNVTGLVDALVATGFVTREPHPTDRRATLVSFTEHGAGTAEALRRGQHDVAQMLFGAMPAERFNCLVEGLDVVLTRLYDHGVSRDREVSR
ncbi:MAG: MarR family winged helix-turn-helix transcriptional regulator, partial [Pseudonocardiaceae bacterium]